MLNDNKKAGEISVKVKIFARTLLNPGAQLVEIADKIENKIIELGAKAAFPTCLSVNEIAAHYVPSFGEKTILKNSDLIKVDIGVHVNGHIADTAFSFSIGESEENQKLIAASKKALDAAVKLAKPGVSVSEIGSAIAHEIISSGFQPIRNLSGHQIEEYNLHAGLVIPNYNSGNTAELKKDMVVAIEPFATSGEGLVIEGKSSETFKLEKTGVVRNGRDILMFVAEEYKTLPFAKRWLIKKFGPLKTNLFLKEAAAKGLLKEYKLLREKTGKKVAQSEHTVIVDDKPIITTE